MYNSAIYNGRYQIIKKIGQGGMSSVFLCLDQHIHKKWALKLINIDGASVYSEQSEISLLKSFNYYMFPMIADAFFYQNQIGIVTEYVEGESLYEHIKREGPLPVNRAIRYYEELLKALMYLHSMNPGILYLDMKPQNIMLRPDGEIRLIDFGIAGSILTKSKSMGTKGYSPPEQYISGGKLSEKTDVFALGMTFYTMLTGEKPDGDLKKQTRQIRANTDIPSYIREIILKSVSRDMEKRPMPEEILGMLKAREGIRKGMLPTVAVGLIAAAAFVITSIKISGTISEHSVNRYTEEMISKASQYIDNGEYNLQGLKIICGYLDGNFLKGDTYQYFCYEVARNYFEIQRDYVMAKTYFKRLDESEYPEKEYYLQLCEMMSGFDRNDTAFEVLRAFSDFNRGLPSGERKENNERLIKFIYDDLAVRTSENATAKMSGNTTVKTSENVTAKMSGNTTVKTSENTIAKTSGNTFATKKGEDSRK